MPATALFNRWEREVPLSPLERAPRSNPLIRPFPVPRKSAKPRQQAAEPRRDLPGPPGVTHSCAAHTARGDQEAQAVTRPGPVTLTPCARSGSRPKRAAATRDSPCGGRAAVPDPGSRWARAAEGGRDGSRPCPTAAGSGEPWRARPAPRHAQARSQGWRAATLGFSSLSVLWELRATGAGNPRRYANPRSTSVRQAPPRREDVDVPSGRPTTPSGREGRGAQRAGARLEAGPKREAECGGRRDQRRSRAGLGRG